LIASAAERAGCSQSAGFSVHDGRNKHTKVESAALAEVFGERLQDGAQDAFAAPLLKSAMAGLVRRKPLRKILPPSSTS
jgi:hypothetical protein